MNIYQLVVFLHVIGLFGFLMAHGISAGVYFVLQHERQIERLRWLLQLSTGTARVMLTSLLVLIVTGVIAGFMGQWWSRGWIWVSLILLIVLWGVMAGLGTRLLNKVRQGIGLPSSYGQAALAEALSADELNALLDQMRPARLAIIGFGGLAIIAWLMLFKPF